MPDGSRLTPPGGKQYDARQAGGAGVALEYQAVQRAFAQGDVSVERLHVDCSDVTGIGLTATVGLAAYVGADGHFHSRSESPTRPDDVLAALEHENEFGIFDVVVYDTPQPMPTRDTPLSPEEAADVVTDPNVHTVVEIECVWNGSPAYSESPDVDTVREQMRGDALHPAVRRHDTTVDVEGDPDGGDGDGDGEAKDDAPDDPKADILRAVRDANRQILYDILYTGLGVPETETGGEASTTELHDDAVGATTMSEHVEQIADEYNLTTDDPDGSDDE